MVMSYFARAKARVWRKDGVREIELWRNLLVDQVKHPLAPLIPLAIYIQGGQL
jgi:hypothetical protein